MKVRRLSTFLKALDAVYTWRTCLSQAPRKSRGFESHPFRHASFFTAESVSKSIAEIRRLLRNQALPSIRSMMLCVFKTGLHQKLFRARSRDTAMKTLSD